MHGSCSSFPCCADAGYAPQVALVEQLLDDVWCGPWALLLNPTWHNTTPTLYQPLVDSFNTLYSFMPIATQVSHGA